MKLTSLLQLVDKLQQTDQIDNLQEVIEAALTVLYFQCLENTKRRLSVSKTNKAGRNRRKSSSDDLDDKKGKN